MNYSYQNILLLFFKTTKSYIIFLLMMVLPCFQACKKFIEISQPVDQLTSEFVFTNDNSAIKALTGIYSEMTRDQQQFSSGFTTFFAGMSADELYYYTPSFRDEFVNNEITLANHANIQYYFWDPCYRYIYAANKCIEGANSSSALSGNIKIMILGEAKFIRAFCYFHLVNFFGDVPLILTTRYQENQSFPRVAEAAIYSQIIKDLIDAKTLLTSDYPSPERVRPNKFAASALLARVYLYNKDWLNAEKEADSVINSGLYTLNEDLNKVFEINSNETIWQLHPVDPNYNTWEGFQIIPTAGASPTYLLTSSLIHSFETNDLRKDSWTMSTIFNNDTLYFPYKYKVSTGSVLTEYYVVLRLAEQLLIRAEARAEQDNINGAKDDLNIIRQRAGLLNVDPSNRQETLLAIEQERRTELFAEWGHRWFDLKRTDRADAVLGALKSSTWQSTDTLWPIPDPEIRLNPALTQNPGY
jgi:hypothetical protein